MRSWTIFHASNSQLVASSKILRRLDVFAFAALTNRIRMVHMVDRKQKSYFDLNVNGTIHDLMFLPDEMMSVIVTR